MGLLALWLDGLEISWYSCCMILFSFSSCWGLVLSSHFTLSWHFWILPPSHWDSGSNWSQKLGQPHLYLAQADFSFFLKEKRLQTSIWLGWKCFRVGVCGKLNAGPSGLPVPQPFTLWLCALPTRKWNRFPSPPPPSLWFALTVRMCQKCLWSFQI